MSGHTKGPWAYSAIMHPPIGNDPQQVDANGNVFWGYSISGCDERGASILPTLGAVHNFPDACEANARLIAAAPELLAVCKMFLEEASPLSLHECIQAAKAAISKVEGTTQ